MPIRKLSWQEKEKSSDHPYVEELGEDMKVIYANAVLQLVWMQACVIKDKRLSSSKRKQLLKSIENIKRYLRAERIQ